MKKWKAILVGAVCLVALALPASSLAGSWTVYWNQMLFPVPSGNHAHSGWAYWTSHRVYRSVTPPTVLHFHLEYCHTDGTCHWSASNATNNPFYYTPYGYSKLWCYWDYWNDSGYLEAYEPSCQGFK